MPKAHPFSCNRFLQGLLLALCVFWAVPSHAQTPYLYYSVLKPNPDPEGNDLPYIGRSTLNGSASFDTWLALNDGDYPMGLAKGPTSLYWAPGFDFISRYNLSNGAINPLENPWINGLAGGYAPNRLAVDATYLYFADSMGYGIGRVKLDLQSAPENTWITLSDPAHNIIDITGLKIYGDSIYWTDANTGAIGCAKLDGSTRPADYHLVPNLGRDFGLYPSDLAVDASYIYFAGGDQITRYNRIAGTPAPLAGSWPMSVPGVVSMCMADQIYFTTQIYPGDGSTTSTIYGVGPSGGIPTLISTHEITIITSITATDPATVISLASFTATPNPSQVELAWRTGSELDTAGFNLWRAASATGAYGKLNPALLPAKGFGIGGASYTWTDTAASAGQTWYYKLEDIDTAGVKTLHGPVSATVGAPLSIQSFQATPPDVFQGGSSLLSWTVTGSPALSIVGLGPVSASSLWVSPSSTVSYLLTDGQGSQSMATVTVKPFALLDMAGLSLAWGSVKGDATYNPCYDLNGDGKVDDLDVVLCLKGL